MHKENKIKKIGDKMPDGTIYGGISPETGTDMFIAPGRYQEVWHSPLYIHSGEICGYPASKVSCYADLNNTEADDGGWRLATAREHRHMKENMDDIGNLGYVSENRSSSHWALDEADKFSAVVFVYKVRQYDRFEGQEITVYPKDNGKFIRPVRTLPRPRT